MFTHTLKPSAAVALAIVVSTSVAWANEEEVAEFDETKVLVEINATDGDAGFHALFDADAWKEARMYDPDENRILEVAASGILAAQGVTEDFFESSEPVCDESLKEEEDERVVTLREFLERFPAGTYALEGTTLDDEPLEGDAELTHALPAAPVILSFVGHVIAWLPGDDLGECTDQTLVHDGIIPDPGAVEIVGWEVTVEPDEDAFEEAGIEGPFRVYTVQLPNPDHPWGLRFVTVPRPFLESYRRQGITEFKVEIGAIEESGNQTFSEREFELDYHRRW